MKTCVAAQKGFNAVYVRSDGNGLQVGEAIIAWFVEENLLPLPITPRGEIMNSEIDDDNYFGCLCPDGRVVTPCGFYEDMDAAFRHFKLMRGKNDNTKT